MKRHLVLVLTLTATSFVAGQGSLAQQQTAGLSDQPPLWSQRVGDWEAGEDAGIAQAFAMEIPSEPVAVQLGLAWYRWDYDARAYVVTDVTTPVELCDDVLFQGIAMAEVLNPSPSTSSIALNLTQKDGTKRLVVLDIDHVGRSAATPHCP